MIPTATKFVRPFCLLFLLTRGDAEPRVPGLGELALAVEPDLEVGDARREVLAQEDFVQGQHRQSPLPQQDAAAVPVGVVLHDGVGLERVLMGIN